MKIAKNIFYLFLPLLGGIIISLIISGGMNYDELVKPVLSPPAFLFPIVWTIIYILMGVSYYLLNKDIEVNKLTKIIYYTQLIVNYLWSIIFFTLKLRLLAVIWIILLDVLVIIMIYQFFKNKKISAYLNLIYLVWILFATYLTISIYILN